MVDEIIKRYKPSAMIDISDGLLSDLGHICESSNTGFQIDADSLPLHPELNKYASRTDTMPIDYALKSGEEYELLFTSPHEINKLNTKDENNAGITKIGFITDRDYILCENGISTKVQTQGYNHFS